jgi:hypothetical protein
MSGVCSVGCGIFAGYSWNGDFFYTFRVSLILASQSLLAQLPHYSHTPILPLFAIRCADCIVYKSTYGSYPYTTKIRWAAREEASESDMELI